LPDGWAGGVSENGTTTSVGAEALLALKDEPFTDADAITSIVDPMSASLSVYVGAVAFVITEQTPEVQRYHWKLGDTVTPSHIALVDWAESVAVSCAVPVTVGSPFARGAMTAVGNELPDCVDAEPPADAETATSSTSPTSCATALYWLVLAPEICVQVGCALVSHRNHL
jgi:hypothetical protein